MNIRWIAVMMLGAAVTWVGGVGFAQQDKGAVATAKPTSAQALDLIDDDVESLTNPQKLERSQQRIGVMKGTLDSTNQMLERARREEKDILKINCINEKLASIKGFLKVSEQSYVSLSDAVSRSDEEASNHHYTLIAIANQKVTNLGEEARVCAGEVVRFAEATQLDVNVDPDIAPDDDVFLGDEDLVVERLPELTNWK